MFMVTPFRYRIILYKDYYSAESIESVKYINEMSCGNICMYMGSDMTNPINIVNIIIRESIIIVLRVLISQSSL